MPAFLRHLLSILLLPVVVTVLVPAWLLAACPPAAVESALTVWLARLAGGLLILLGLGLFAWCVALFGRVGQGTLAPWDPTRKLVSLGPYRHMRNPMISGVALILLGRALFSRSLPLGLWALAFILINHIYFVFSEEPGLEKRFGESYRRYKEHVPRWLPRKEPWEGSM